nr:hypothetical protein [Bifidobacterium psychraerophilum]
MLLSAMTALLVPRVLGIDEFGYWQLFMFYSSYVGFFHFGVNDGIYLINGGTPRSKLNKRAINTQFIIVSVFQTFLALILFFAAGQESFVHERVFVLQATAVFFVLNNLSNFLGFLFQAMNETKLYSFSVIVDRLSFLVPLVYFLFSAEQNFESYIAAYVISKTLCLAYCCYNARDILTAGLNSPKTGVHDTAVNIRAGFKLMLANISSMLILGITRFLIDANFGIRVFGKISFALSLVIFFLTFISQGSLVLFPALRQSGKTELERFFSNIRDLMSLLLPLIYLLYYPMVWLMDLWLPNYQDALNYLALLLPICVFECRMDICCTTYLKVLRRENWLLLINLLTVVISSGGALLGVHYFHSIHVILASAVFGIVLRSIVSELLLCRIMDAPFKGRIILGEVAITIIVILLTICVGHGVAGFLATTFTLSMYYMSNRRTFIHLLSTVHNRFLLYKKR